MLNRIFGITPDDSPLLNSLLSTFTTDVGGANVIESEGKASLKENPTFEDVRERIECYGKKINAVHAKMMQAFNECSTFPCCQDFKITYQELADDMLLINTRMAFLQNTEVKEKTDALKEAQTKLNTCTDLAAKIKRQKEIEKMPEADRNKEPIKSELAKLIKDIDGRKECDKTEMDALNAEIGKLENELALFDALKTLNSKFPTDDEIKRALIFINGMTDQSQTYKTERLTLNANRMDLTINIQRKDSLASNGVSFFKKKPLPVQRQIEIPIVGRGFASFSSGSFVGLGLFNKVYDWQPLPNNSGTVTADAKYILTESANSIPVSGFSALANIEWKWAKAIGAGLSTGVGLTIEKKPRYAYLLGASLFLGDTHQFAITGGVAIMHMNTLKNNLKAVYDQKISFAKADRQDIEYYQELKFGTFISITYTPFTIRTKPKTPKK